MHLDRQVGAGERDGERETCILVTDSF